MAGKHGRYDDDDVNPFAVSAPRFSISATLTPRRLHSRRSRCAPPDPISFRCARIWDPAAPWSLVYQI